MNREMLHQAHSSIGEAARYLAVVYDEGTVDVGTGTLVAAALGALEQARLLVEKARLREGADLA